MHRVMLHSGTIIHQKAYPQHEDSITFVYCQNHQAKQISFHKSRLHLKLIYIVTKETPTNTNSTISALSTIATTTVTLNGVLQLRTGYPIVRQTQIEISLN